MNDHFFLFGFLLWSVKTTDAAVVAPSPNQKPAYGICVDITLCQNPAYKPICSQGLPICPSPVKPATQTATKRPSPTPSLPRTTNKVTSSAIVTTGASVKPATKTIAPSKPTAFVKSTHISAPTKQLNILTIQNNYKISFGKKSNVTKPGT
ncbi:uncharacterized protein LOC114535716 [Dendronephthya gigantea]|uniref:uncharacterized protein LOC114535716 n=1 Tax=Dendronephthya gigantea TaxID=151771 RepID=UPI00106D8585|nr:uncharacterized protein LOC114535716 [Dendronephthya gigantea]